MYVSPPVQRKEMKQLYSEFSDFKHSVLLEETAKPVDARVTSGKKYNHHIACTEEQKEYVNMYGWLCLELWLLFYMV